jgi:YesN/AraC family two-component response regulator
MFSKELDKVGTMNLQHPGFSLRFDPSEDVAHRSTILIIDDHEAARTYIRETLSEAYVIAEASNSEDGVRVAKQIVPDLIITALTTQVLDNESLCIQLKHCESTNHIPIVILSENNDPSNRIKSFYFGADDYMPLPLQQAELHVRIENLIQSRKTLKRKFSKQIDLNPPSIELQSKDERFLQRIMTVMAINMDNHLFGSEQFAEQMGVSHRHLSRKLMSLTGQSCNEFIRRMRLQRAAELLNKHTGNVKEVAHKVGFNNLSYFAKCFKQFHKYSPSDFSKRITS